MKVYFDGWLMPPRGLLPTLAPSRLGKSTRGGRLGVTPARGSRGSSSCSDTCTSSRLRPRPGEDSSGSAERPRQVLWDRDLAVAKLADVHVHVGSVALRQAA